MTWWDWLNIGLLLAYAAAIVYCGVMARRLVRGPWPEAVIQWRAWRLSAVSLFGGMLMTAVATPDWSPVTMLLGCLPFWFVAVWAARFAVLACRGLDQRSAASRSLLFALPLLLVAPVGLVLALMLWVPGVVAAGTLLFLKRPRDSTAL